MLNLDVIEFRREITNRVIEIEAEEATEVAVKVAVKDPVTGEMVVETRLEPRMIKKMITRLEPMTREFVEYAAPGLRQYRTVVKSMDEIRSIADAVPGEEDDEDKVAQAAKRDRILAEYESWKSGHAMPEFGTPLGAWPAISPKTAEMFKMQGISTVEQVSEMTESAKARVAHIGDIAGLIKQAKMFLASADTLKASQSMLALEAANAELKEQIADSMAAMQQMQAMLLEMKAAKDTDDGKPKRGRPPREAIEDAA